MYYIFYDEFSFTEINMQIRIYYIKGADFLTHIRGMGMEIILSVSV